MAADRQWRWHWWLPGREEESVPGTLVQRANDGDIALLLIGGFNVEVLTPLSEHHAAVSFQHAWPMIHGACAGERFTLLQCLARHTSGGLWGNVSEQDVSALRVLRGIHLTDPDEAVFDSATLAVEYLLGWTRKTTLNATVELNEWKWTGHQTVTTTPADDLTACHDGLDYILSVVFNQFRVDDRPRTNERSIASREWAELRIASPEPVGFTALDSTTKAVTDLMTLVAHAPAGVIRETLWFTPSDAHPSGNPRRTSVDVEVLGQPIHRPRPGDNESDQMDYLFTLDDTAFSKVLPKWLNFHQQTWLACGMLFGLSYIPGGYTQARLLTAASAAESLHRSLHPQPKKVDFRRRLELLAAEPDGEAVNALIGDVPGWAKYVTEQRNGVAHGDRDRLDAIAGRLVLDATEVTKALLGLVMLKRMDLSAEVQRRAAALPYLATHVEEFK
jgi:hypothetical protein